MKTIIGFLLCLLSFSIISNAQKKTITKEVSFLTKDSITINATFETPKLKTSRNYINSSRGATRNEWKNLKLWNDLLEKGYAILAYDIRIYGTSEKDKGDLYD